MSQIPSTERTNDFISMGHCEKGCSLRDLDDPHLFGINVFIGPSSYSADEPTAWSIFHSLDIVTYRDKVQVKDIELLNFFHRRGDTFNSLVLEFRDPANTVTEHEYMVRTIVRYFA